MSAPVGPSGRVLVVDDHALVADSLAVALRARGIAATAVEPRAFLPTVDEFAPTGGVVMLDLDLGGGLDGVTLVPRLRRAGWRVLVVSATSDETRIAIAVAAGALGHVSKSAPFDELVTAAVRTVEGRWLLDRGERDRLTAIAASATATARAAQDRWSRLTPRELQIVDRMAAGRRPAAIAEEFVVSVATVRTQVRSILAKLELGSQLEVAALARSRGA